MQVGSPVTDGEHEHLRWNRWWLKHINKCNEGQQCHKGREKGIGNSLL